MRGVRDVRAGRADRVVRPQHVDRDDPVEHPWVTTDERELGSDAGVHDDDVEPAERADHVFDPSVDVVADGDSQCLQGAAPRLRARSSR